MTSPPATDPRTSILRFPSSPPPSVVLRSASPKLQGSPLDRIFQNLSPSNIGYEAFSTSNAPLSVFSSPYDSQSRLMGFCDSNEVDALSSNIYYPENDILFEPLHIATLDKGNMVSSPSDWIYQYLGDDVDISSHKYVFDTCGLPENDNNGLSDFGDAVAVPTTDSIYNSEFMLGATMESLMPISCQNENVELFNTLDNELTRVVESCNSKYFVNLLCGEDNQELLDKVPSFDHPIGRPLQFKETLDGKRTDDVTCSATNLISSAGLPSSKCVVQSHVQLGQTSGAQQEGSIAFPSTSRMHHLPDSLQIKQLTEQTVLDERGTPATQGNDNGTVEGFRCASVQRDRRTISTSDKKGKCKKCCCKRSKCLKLYCECFRSGSYCDGCGCENCHNTPEHKDAVADARRQIENRTATAFAPKVIRPLESMPERNLATPASARHRRGCNCRKSMCNKKYCECYQSEVGCSDACRCDQCSNFYGTRKGKAHHQSTKREIFGDIRNLTPLGNEGRSLLQVTDAAVCLESPSNSIAEHGSCLLSPYLLKENYTQTLVNLPIPATNTQASSLKRQGSSPPQSQSKKLKISSTDSIKVIHGL